MGEEVSDKPPVLLQHAMGIDMFEWMMNHPDVAPALVTARAGYDVWMGNNRGNRWSDKHVSLDPKSAEYWDFDWEEMGTKDTPAVLDYISHTTGHE